MCNKSKTPRPSRAEVERFCLFLDLNSDHDATYERVEKELQAGTPWCCVLFALRVWEPLRRVPEPLDPGGLYMDWLDSHMPPGKHIDVPCPSCAVHLLVMDARYASPDDVAESQKKIVDSLRFDEKHAVSLENLELSKFFVEQWRLSVGARHFVCSEAALSESGDCVYRCGCGWRGTPFPCNEQGFQAGKKEASAHRSEALQRPGSPVVPYDELTNEQLAQANADDLRTAYRELLAHHVAETTALQERLMRAQEDLGTSLSPEAAN